MPGSILGNAVRRVEDPELLVGTATYVADLPLDGALHLAFVRSPVAHGRLLGVDLDDARARPGVVAAFAAGQLDLPAFHGLAVLNRDCPRPPLAHGKVRFVGEPVAVVVAASAGQALDAAEAVAVDIDPLPAVVDPEAALAPGAPLQFEELGTNLAAGSREGDADGVLDDAEVVVRGRFENQRIAVAPLEGDAVAVVPDGERLVAYVSTQMPHLWRDRMSGLFGIPPEDLRVVAPHVGGAFGGKAGPSAEHFVAVAVARHLGRPVRWVQTRSENLVAMTGRGQVQYAELGLRRDGTITGLRCRIVADAGAYAGFGGALALGPTRNMAQGPYRIPKLAYAAAAAMTNTAPTGAFRGAGRPEATAMLERLLDLAARELDLDPVELRRRNLLTADAFPYETLVGTRYDSGDYVRALDEAVRLAGYDELRRRQAERAADPEAARRRLGIGVSAYVEITAGGAQTELGAVEVHDDGTATVRAGTSGHGQGHATAFSMIVADRLGIPMASIRFVQSDTSAVPRGGGTGGSRSLQLGGSAVATAADAVLDRARRLVAAHLEADPADIAVFDDGTLGVAGVPARSLPWGEVAELAATAEHDEGGPLAAELDFVQAGATFPFGAHVAVVEVDTETGAVHHLRHVAVDDCGTVLNPLLVAGQQHGGIAQGAAQVLWEQVLHDDDGNPVTSTFADYGIPTAAELPSFEATGTETPSPLNPLGAKGIGESGTIGAMPAVHGAVLDALAPLGVRHVDMPCTPERIWRAIAEPADPWREPPEVFAGLRERSAAPTPPPADVDI